MSIANVEQKKEKEKQMKTFKVKVKDARPQVGIFEIVDGKVYYDSKVCDPLDAVGGAVDAGALFHRDLCRQILKNHANELEDESKRILSLPESKSPWMYFPRGRVWYDVNNDKYCISTCKEAFNIPNVTQVLMNLFSLPPLKIVKYADGDYDLWDKENLKL